MVAENKLIALPNITSDTGWTTGEKVILEQVGGLLFGMKLCDMTEEGETELGEPWILWSHEDAGDPIYSIARHCLSFVCHVHGFTFVAEAPSVALLVSKVWPMFSKIIT